MSVYVDQPIHPFGRMVMCHMMADTTEELLSMADRIGVQRKWIQKAGTPREHFDVCMSKRRLAVEHGAVEMTPKDMARWYMPRLRAAMRAESEAKP
jgi:hypothetical protein